MHSTNLIHMYAGATNSNLYTVRVYRSPPHTTGDRMALVIVSFFHRLFFDVRTLQYTHSVLLASSFSYVMPSCTYILIIYSHSCSHSSYRSLRLTSFPKNIRTYQLALLTGPSNNLSVLSKLMQYWNLSVTQPGGVCLTREW